MQIICPDENALTAFTSRITRRESLDSANFIHVDMINTPIDSNIIAQINTFCALKSLNALHNPLKVVILKQYAEVMHDTLIQCIENYIHMTHVKFILLATSSHVTYTPLKPKLITLHLKPKNRIHQNILFHKKQMFYKIIHCNIQHHTLSRFVILWHKLYSLKTPHHIHIAWRSHIIKHTLLNSL